MSISSDFLSVMLTKNYDDTFEFVNVIIGNILSSFRGLSNNGIFGDAVTMSAIRGDMLLYGKSFFLCFTKVKTEDGSCQKLYENIFRCINVMLRRLLNLWILCITRTL